MAKTNRFAKNLVKLSSSTIVSQALLLLTSPILTRLYSPSDFGVFAFFIGIIGVLSTVANLRYEQAIIVPESRHSANQLVYLSLIINSIFSLIILIILTLFSKPIFTLFKIEEYEKYSWLIPISVFFIGCYQAFNYWLVRNKKFNTIAKIKVQQSVAMISIQLILFKIGAIALILGHSTGQLLGVFKNGMRFLKNSNLDAKHLKDMASKYRNFPKFSIWSALLNSTGSQLPVLMFTAYYSPAIAGLYMLTQRVIKGPLSIVSQAITQIFISDLRQSSTVKHKLLKINNLLITLSIIPLTLIVVAGDKVFPLIFGPQWADVSSVASVLTPWIFAVFICSPVATLVEFNNKQSSFLIFQLVLFISRVASIYLGYILFDNYLDSLMLFSYSSTIIWLFFLSYIMKLCNIKLLEWAKPLILKVSITSILFAPVYFITFDGAYFWIILSVSTLMSIICIFNKDLLNYEN